MSDHETVNVRYMVDDVASAVEFYTTQLRLLLSGPESSAGRPMPDGAQPAPGGWNRIHLIFADLAAEIERLRSEGVPFRNDVVTGPGGFQILIQDPSGNLIELFQPAG
jgi:predicted enzyme related to lactoylglutathione lyase